MKPSNSRPSAVTIWFLFLPRAAMRLVAFVQSLLRLPGDLLDFLAERQVLLPAQKKPDHIRPMLIRPRRLHQHPSEVSVAGLGDPAALHAIAAGVFRWPPGRCSPSVAAGLETRQRAQFGDDAWPPWSAPRRAAPAALR